MLYHAINYQVSLSGFCSIILPRNDPTRPPQPSNRTTNRLDITDLDKVVQQLFSASITHSTHGSYQSVAHRYLQFCHFYNITSPYLVLSCIYSLKSYQGTIRVIRHSDTVYGYNYTDLLMQYLYYIE